MSLDDNDELIGESEDEVDLGKMPNT